MKTNKINLNKKPLNKVNLMKLVDDVAIYKYYTGKEVGTRTNMISPLRPKEKNPSFGYFVGKTGEICFNDFVLGKGDCIRFIEFLFSLKFYDAMSRIVIDFRLEDKLECNQIGGSVRKEIPVTNRDATLKKLSEGRVLTVRRRKWQLHDLQFWFRFGITKPTLLKYNVVPVDYIFVNGSPISTDRFAYAFIEYKDGIETFKIYQPYNKHYKWLNNHDESIWQGWTNLIKEGPILIITKSLKDVMSINDVLEIPAIALQSESVIPKGKIITELKNRFSDVYILYDNDYDKRVNWGEKYSKNLSLEFGLYFSQIPKEYKSKDFSDLVFNIGEVKAKKTWDDVLCIPY